MRRREMPRRRLTSVVFGVAILVGLSTGYLLGRGIWTIPAVATTRLPLYLTTWLTPPNRILPPAEPAVELNQYAFEMVNSEVKQDAELLPVRLINAVTGQRIGDAVIFGARFDMRGEDMKMSTEGVAEPSDEPGLYFIKTRLPMLGPWELTLAAKVQGETGTVGKKLMLHVVQ